MEDIQHEVNGNYDASQIQVLEGLEAVRRRPGMYIGSTDSRGLHHLIYELVDNSIDEAMAGYCDHVTITVHEGEYVTVITVPTPGKYEMNKVRFKELYPKLQMIGK